MNQRELDLETYLALFLGALRVLAPRDNEPLNNMMAQAEDLIHTREIGHTPDASAKEKDAKG